MPKPSIVKVFVVFNFRFLLSILFFCNVSSTSFFPFVVLLVLRILGTISFRVSIFIALKELYFGLVLVSMWLYFSRGWNLPNIPKFFFYLVEKAWDCSLSGSKSSLDFNIVSSRTHQANNSLNVGVSLLQKMLITKLL